MAQFLCRNSNPAILHFETQLDVRRRRFDKTDMNLHPALRGEFDGITQIVEQCLRYPSGISAQPGGQIWRIQGQDQALALSTLTNQAHDPCEQFRQIEIHLLHFQLARLNP